MNETKTRKPKADKAQTGSIKTGDMQSHEPDVRRNYKDTVFRMLFSSKENLLSLYNALNGTDYMAMDSLEITTLKNAVYMNYKNDVSFVFDFELLLYEHQSTVNPNMPLRDLIYVTRMLQGLTRNANLYSSFLVRIPAPRFVVFYNGVDFQPEQQVLHLSDAFVKKQAHPALELDVIIYNINFGHNQKLLDACRLLREYAQYVAQVRTYAQETDFPEAVERAVTYCIKNGILSDFLSKNRAEVIAVSIFEYDEEQHIKSEREEWREVGREEGLSIGRKEGLSIGRDTLALMLKSLLAAGKAEEMQRVLSDSAYRDELWKDYLAGNE